MKKILTTLVTLGTLVSTANADFLRAEIGGGMWKQKPSGSISGETAGSGGLKGGKATYIDTSGEDGVDQNYLWAFIKHPVPILPNIRLEYSKIENSGVADITGTMSGFSVPLSGAQNTFLDAEQYDITPYYNLLDNTFWISVDLGLTLRMMEMNYNVGANQIVDAESIVLPLVYSRVRGEVPFVPSLGIEGTIKWLSDGGDNTITDFFIKADYTFKAFPVFEPGLEVGYRSMSFEGFVENGDTKTNIDLTFEGVYFGLMARF